MRNEKEKCYALQKKVTIPLILEWLHTVSN